MSLHHILIVEDEANLRFMLEQALRSPEQWSIQTAANGKEALDCAREHMPTLVITDYNMATMNGIELITQLRATGVPSRIILMTAYSSPELLEAANSLDVDHYLAKPVPLKLLRVITADAIQRYASPNY